MIFYFYVIDTNSKIRQRTRKCQIADRLQKHGLYVQSIRCHAVDKDQNKSYDLWSFILIKVWNGRKLFSYFDAILYSYSSLKHIVA